LNQLLLDQQPKTFSSSWILKNSPASYRFIVKNVRTELGDIDWDKVISGLKRELQPTWHPLKNRPKRIKKYHDQQEVNIILKKYHHKLYVFITALESEDKQLRNEISIILVRVAQKGNLNAQKQLIKLLRYLTDQWIEYSPSLFRWRGYSDQLESKFIACIRCYRFTGSFIGYLYKTLEYSSRGFKRLESYSLDSYIGDSKIRLIDSVTSNPETGEIGLFKSCQQDHIFLNN